MRRRTLDGTTLELDGLEPDEYVIEEFAWHTNSSGWSSGFQVAAPHVAETILAEVMRGATKQSTPCRGGTLFMGDSTSEGKNDGTLIGWRGNHHSVYTVVPEGSVDLAAALRRFEGLELTDAPDGLVLFSQAQGKNLVRRVVMASHRTGDVLVDVKRTSSEALTVIPAGAGASVPGGEVWRTECDAAFAVVMLAPTAVAVLSSDNEQPLLKILDRLRVAWGD